MPEPTADTRKCASCFRQAEVRVTFASPDPTIDGSTELACSVHRAMYRVGSVFPGFPARADYAATPEFTVTAVDELPDPAAVTEISATIDSFLTAAQGRADQATAKVAELRDAWVEWRTERHFQVDGVDRRLAATLAGTDWLSFVVDLRPALARGRRVAAIKSLRQWVRTGPHATVGLREARDWVDAYRAATGFDRVAYRVDPNGSATAFFPFHVPPDKAAGLVRLGDVPDRAVVRFPDSLAGEVIVSRTDSAFPGRIGSLETRNVETGEQAFRYAVAADTSVTVLSGPPSEPRPATPGAI